MFIGFECVALCIVKCLFHLTINNIYCCRYAARKRFSWTGVVSELISSLYIGVCVNALLHYPTDPLFMCKLIAEGSTPRKFTVILVCMAGIKPIYVHLDCNNSNRCTGCCTAPIASQFLKASVVILSTALGLPSAPSSVLIACHLHTCRL